MLTPDQLQQDTLQRLDRVHKYLESKNYGRKESVEL